MNQNTPKKNTPSLQGSISRISLVVFIILLVFSVFLTSGPGGRVGYYAIMTFFAIVPTVFGPKRYRIFGIIALIFSVWFLYVDYKAGIQYWEKIRQNAEELNRSAD
ncbi:MAG: hypothetical protein LBV12_01295 [Puniceicoccales bacterium]|jgi:predicted membrane protein|nr:hypothetical protein [Puniceicoccales bacterium]